MMNSTFESLINKNMDQPGIYFCYYGKNDVVLDYVKKHNTKGIFLELYPRKQYQLHPLTPTCYILQSFKRNVIYGRLEYRKFIFESNKRKKALLELAKLSQQKPIFLVGFYKDPNNDFRSVIADLINELKAN